MEDFHFSAKFRGLLRHEKKGPTHGNPTSTPQKSGEPILLSFFNFVKVDVQFIKEKTLILLQGHDF